MQITETEKYKRLVSNEVNYIFNKVNGVSAVWGETIEDDPEYSPYGPFIADIEITTICSGINNVPCSWCYKSNTQSGNNMSLETFKTIFNKLPHREEIELEMEDGNIIKLNPNDNVKTSSGIKKAKLNQVHVTQQIAFGVDSKCTSNPDTFKIFDYCRSNGVIPNVTVADITDDTADRLTKLCGAVSVSHYPSMYKDGENNCYESVKKLTDRGLTQVNIHQLLSTETLEDVYRLLNDVKTDNRLSKLNAIVFLSLKQVGRGVKYNCVSQEDYNKLVNYCLNNNIKFGFDSCGCGAFLESVKEHPKYEMFKMLAEPCESTRFSVFCNVNGMVSPCSFLEEKMIDEVGLDIINCDDFIKNIWFNEKTITFRKKSIDCANKMIGCPVYNIRKDNED